MKKNIIILLSLLTTISVEASIGVKELSDSLTQYTGFSQIWSPMVRVRQMRVSDNNVTIHTNATLTGISWNAEKIKEIEEKVSQWVLGHPNGNVQIFTQRININELVTSCADDNRPPSRQKDLTDKHIALWPSHGLYFNQSRQEWIWQRATLWTTVEDLYSQEYTRLIRKMLENAGATIHMPRAGLEHSAIGQSGLPQWTQGAKYWLMDQKLDSTIWDMYDGDHYKDDMKCRAMWVNYLSGGSSQNPLQDGLKVPIDLCLAIHTDGIDSENDSTIIGTLCIYTTHDDDNNKSLANGKDRRQVNRELADWIQTQIVNDLTTIAPNWTRRQLLEANYCESRVPVVPSVLVELLSHKNMADMKYGLDPQFRFTTARALYKGVLRYINGKNAIVQPLPVKQIAIKPNGEISWEPTMDHLEPTANPTYYLLYIQEDEGEWNVQQVNTNYHKMLLKPGVQYNYYVVACNAGGLSFPSPVASAYISTNPQSPIAMIIDGFDDTYGPQWFADSLHAGIVPGSYACEDRYTCAYIGQQWDYIRDSKWINDDNCGWGACYRDHAGEITIGNTRDYTAQHGRVLRKLNMSYISTTRNLAQIDSIYSLVDYICGRQRQPLPESMQLQISQYLSQGGKLLLSTDRLSTIDKEWAKQNLGTAYHAKNATRSGKVHFTQHKPFQLLLAPNSEQLFSATPEGLMPQGSEARTLASYMDMRCPAAVGCKHINNATTLVWGFPLEAVTDFDRIYQLSIEWLLDN